MNVVTVRMKRISSREKTLNESHVAELVIDVLV